MTNKQILEKVIQKAINNGWDNRFFVKSLWQVKYYGKKDKDDIEANLNCGQGSEFDLFSIIFNHNFAKALWGNKDMELNHNGETIIMANFPTYKYHLQQLVLEEDYINYLKKFI